MRLVWAALAAMVMVAACETGAPSDPVAASMSAYPKTTSVLALRNGVVVYENYFGDGGPAVLNNTRSATKSVTALAVGAAIADGQIGGVDDRVAAYFPEGHPWRDGGVKEAITIRDLLTMSSALDCNDNDPDSPGNEENMYPLEHWYDWVHAIPASAENAGHWRYCTAGVVLLGELIEAATGEKVDAYTERRLLRPLGITSERWFRSPSGEVMTGGGLELTARDLSKLAELVLHRGQWNGEAIIPAAFIDDALSVSHKVNDDQDYGYLFWRRDYAGPCGALSGWYMAGNGGNAVIIFPEINGDVVVTRTRYNTRGMHQETIDLVEKEILPLLVSCGK